MQDKVIGLDLGTTTMGVARSDVLGLVHGVDTVRFCKNQYVVARKYLHKFVEETGIKEIVIGLPCYPSGDPCEMTNVVLRFIDDVKREDPTLDIHTEDEQGTTVEAHESINELGINHKKRMQSVDRIAACYILERYLQRKELHNGNH